LPVREVPSLLGKDFSVRLVVTDEHERDTALGRPLAHNTSELSAEGSVERRERLVQQQELRFG
jgi:hypothetical protein